MPLDHGQPFVFPSRPLIQVAPRRRFAAPPPVFFVALLQTAALLSLLYVGPTIVPAVPSTSTHASPTPPTACQAPSTHTGPSGSLFEVILDYIVVALPRFWND